MTTLPDYWAENHGMVHPTYTASGILFAASIATQLRLFGRDIPEEVFWNRREVYENLKRTVDDYGFMLALQGMDWNYLPGLSGNMSHAFASVFFEDREAAMLESLPMKQAEMRLASFDGRFYDPNIADRADDIQDPLFLRELTVNMATWGYLFHRLFGPGADPVEKDVLEKYLAGARVWNHAGVAHSRHAHGQTSFSWRNSVMALPVTSEGITVIGPTSDSFLGQPRIKDRPASQRLISCQVDRTEKGFSAALTMDRAQDSIRQDVLFVSLPDGRTLSFERFEARKDLTVEELAQGELTIINERFPAYPNGNCRGERVLYSPDGKQEFKGWLGDSEEDDELAQLGQPGWINIDDRMGFVFQGSGEATYLNRHYHKPYHAIHDRLALSRVPKETSFKKGQTVAWLAALLLPEQHHDETSEEWMELLDSLEGAAAMMTRGALAAANFEDVDRSLSFDSSRTGAFQLFPGVSAHLDREACRYEVRLPARRSSFFEAVGALAANGPLDADVTADGTCFLTNAGDAPVEALLEKDGSPPMEIQPGETVSIQP